MKRSQGFTLVELVIVIVILGILAVTAAPKFFNFATDARVSTLNGVKGSLTSAGAMVFGKAVLVSKQALPTATLTSPAIDIVYGYPAATVTAVQAAVDLETTEWDIALETGPLVSIRPKDKAYVAAGAANFATTACQLTYGPATLTAKPVITVSTGGC
ncbi:MAG: type II secretion system GspH family protein [Gammaproteobacteria bacterium]|nr:type II secretion system GspH family protein [Gammaproteobacteria bacterium]MBU2278690.1 type II secretion system GspH family protein [Gammaproteobacteria bacterium]MBU2428768.1 type II secretion system GspH family protein [Gammaproteobacteria bacterium]